MNLAIFDDEMLGKAPKTHIQIKEMNTRDIAIIGISGALPMCDTLDDYWENIVKGVECIQSFPKERKKDTDAYLKFKGLKPHEINYVNASFLDKIDAFDAKAFRISPKEATLMDPKQRLFLENTWSVIEDAGYSIDELKGQKIGVYAGFSDQGGYTYFDILKDVDPSSINEGLTGNLNAIIPSRVSYLLDFKGPSLTLDTACSSSLVAVHIACKALRENECDAAIVGSVRLHLFPIEKGYRMGFESKDGRTKAFDNNATGTGIGEGAVCIMLKPLFKAEQAGDHIYAVIKGTAINQDGDSVGITAPNADSQADVIEQAWKDAGVLAEEISYIETHGTGTILGDPVEIDGISKAFYKYTEKKQFCGIGSVKNNIGHLFEVAGLASLVKCIYGLEAHKIPPTINVDLPNKLIDFENSPVYISDRLSEWDQINNRRLCGISSFGISGTNCHIVLEEYNKTEESFEESSVLALSGKTPDVLRKLISKYLKNFNHIRTNNPKDVAYTALVGRNHYKHRIAIVFNSYDELEHLLGLVLNKGFEHIMHKNIYYSCITDEMKESSDLMHTVNAIDFNRYQGREAYERIAHVYINSIAFNWRELFAYEKRKRVRLPCEIFDKKRHWLDITANQTPCLEAVLEGRANGDYTQTEQNLSMIIKKILGYDKINIHDNFFEFGGDSILVSKLHMEISEFFALEFSIADIYSYPTIGQLAKCIDEMLGHKQVVTSSLVKKEIEEDDIAIIGMAGRFPLADNIDDYWENLCKGKNCITNMPLNRKKDLKNYLSHLNYTEEDVEFSKGGYLSQIAEFDYTYFDIPLEEATLMDPNQKAFIEVAFEVMEHAGYGGDRLKGTNTGVFVGYTDNFLCTLGRFIYDTDPALIKMAYAGNMAAFIPGRLSYMLDLRGPSMAVDTACSSSLVAVNYAVKSLRSGECDCAIVGSSHIRLIPIDEQESKIGIESNSGAVRAFDDSADGTVEGEAVCAIMLKPLKQAIANGDTIQAIIKGTAINQDGTGLGLMAPRAQTQTEVILKAWEDAAIDPTTLSYIETHGTGTKLGDPIEIEGLRKAFETRTNRKQFCAITSLKSNIGHTYQAAGIASLIKAVLSLQHKMIPPTINFERPNRLIAFENSPFYVNNRLSQWESDGTPRHCGISSFGLSGTNAHVILEEYNNQNHSPNKENNEMHIFTLSAKSVHAMNKLIESYCAFLNDDTHLDFNHLCYTSNIGRGHYNFRIAIITNNQNDLRDKLYKIKDNAWEAGTEENVFYGDLQGKKYIYNSLTEESDLLTGNSILYIKGNSIEWKELYDKNQVRVIPLPTYPFAKSKCWFEPKLNKRKTYSIQEEKTEDTPVDKEPNHLTLSKVESTPIDTNNYEAPTNQLETDLVEIWRMILNNDAIGINDNFFDVGGDSLGAIRMEAEMEKRGIETNETIASSIYQYPTIKQLLTMRADIKYLV